jgi:GPH family glycoside/pentoside/hexuronide:cation symporter
MWGFGGLADNFMFNTMTADVCDDDELRSGRRREGMFSAVKGFAIKAAQGLTFGLGGYMATAAGYDPTKVEQSCLDEATAWKMKLALIGFTMIGLMVAMAIMWFYSITREKAAETQHRLRAKAS